MIMYVNAHVMFRPRVSHNSLLIALEHTVSHWVSPPNSIQPGLCPGMRLGMQAMHTLNLSNHALCLL